MIETSTYACLPHTSRSLLYLYTSTLSILWGAEQLLYMSSAVYWYIDHSYVLEGRLFSSLVRLVVSSCDEFVLLRGSLDAAVAALLLPVLLLPAPDWSTTSSLVTCSI